MCDELAIAEFTSREFNHYPLSVEAMPGHELGLRVEFDTDVFDAAGIERLVERLQQVLVAMTADWGGVMTRRGGGCCRSICSMPVSMTGWMSGAIGRC